MRGEGKIWVGPSFADEQGCGEVIDVEQAQHEAIHIFINDHPHFH